MASHQPLHDGDTPQVGAEDRWSVGALGTTPALGAYGAGDGTAASSEAAAASQSPGFPDAFLEAAFESMSDGLLLIGVDRRLTHVNRRARELLRLHRAPPASLDELLESVRVLDDRGEPVPWMRLPSTLALLGDATRRIRLVVEFPDGQRVGVSAGAAPVRAGDGTLMGAVLRLGNPAPGPELQEDLARVISEDLRPPLGAILVQAKLLGRRSEGAQAVRARSETIAASVQRIEATLNDLHESVLLENGRLRLELVSVDLLDMVRRVRGHLPAAYPGERIGIEPCRALPRVLADPNRLERVLVNLFTGALRRSPPGTHVAVRLGSGAGEVVLEVEDEGETLGRARPAAAEPPAAAEDQRLALHISRALVEAHGGTMACDAGARGRGNAVRVRLPLRPPAATS